MEKAHVTIPQTVPLMLFGVHAQVSFQVDLAEIFRMVSLKVHSVRSAPFS